MHAGSLQTTPAFSSWDPRFPTKREHMIMEIILGVLGALPWFLALEVVFSCFRLHGEVRGKNGRYRGNFPFGARSITKLTAGKHGPLLPERAFFGRAAWRLLKKWKTKGTGLTGSPTKNWNVNWIKWSRITETSG